MDGLAEMIISHIDVFLKYMTFNAESINNYVSAIGSHISHLSASLPSLPLSRQYLSLLAWVQLEDQVDYLSLLLAGDKNTINPGKARPSFKVPPWSSC